MSAYPIGTTTSTRDDIACLPRDRYRVRTLLQTLIRIGLVSAVETGEPGTNRDRGF